MAAKEGQGEENQTTIRQGGGHGEAGSPGTLDTAGARAWSQRAMRHKSPGREVRGVGEEAAAAAPATGVAGAGRGTPATGQAHGRVLCIESRSEGERIRRLGRSLTENQLGLGSTQ